MEIILILLVISGVFWLIAEICGRIATRGLTRQERIEYNKACHEAEQRRTYNNFMYTCPMCGSKKVKTISKVNRGASVAMFGVASDKIGKCYECDNCKYKW